MKALITGVGGFCGARLVSRLRQDGVEIAGFDRMAAPPPHVMVDRYFRVDITDAAATDSAIGAFRPDWLFHLAGLSGNAAAAPSIYDVNVTGTVHILDAARRHVPDCGVLLVGSFAEYGPVDASVLPVTEETSCHPVGPYGISKHAATLAGLDYAKRFGLKVIVARPSNIIGPGIPSSLVAGALLARAKQALTLPEPIVRVGDIHSERDFIAVSDVVDAYVLLVQARLSGEIFNLCSGQACSVWHLAKTLLANSPRPIALVYDPDLVPPSAIPCLYGSYAKAQRAIGFRPSISLEESLKAAWLAELGVGAACV